MLESLDGCIVRGCWQLKGEIPASEPEEEPEMRTLRALSFLLLTAVFSTAALAGSVEINFDNLSNMDVVTNQYAGVLFSSTPGNVNYVTTQSQYMSCLLYTSPSPRDGLLSRMP